MGPVELLVLIVIGLVIILSLLMMALWFFSLVHAIQNHRLDSTMKLLWVLLIVFVAPFGSILYFLIGRNPH